MPDRPPFARVALVGVSGAGKTTLFSALVGMDYNKAVAAGGKMLKAPVRVEDVNLLRLHREEEPQAKLTCPTFELCDTPPVVLDGPDKDKTKTVLTKLRDMDGMVVLLKDYEDGSGDAQLEAIRTELLLSDADALQRRMERIDERMKRTMPKTERVIVEEERAALPALVEALSEGNIEPLQKLTNVVEKQLRTYSLYARKPLLVVRNIAEKDIGKKDGLCLRLEQELLGMEAEERAEFMKDYGLDHLGLPDLPAKIRQEMGILLFLTCGETEVAAWPVKTGSTAPEAAGEIHTDLQKGFINAEVIAWNDWVEIGSMKEAERKKQRLEGKAYVVQDYDIIHIKSAM